MDEPNIPVMPFEPIAADEAPAGEPWIAQVKWDGVRMLAYGGESGVRLFNRRMNERTLHYPELSRATDYCRSNRFVLDGEMIAFDESKPSFREIMKRDGIRQPSAIERAVRTTPVAYMVFDVLSIDGEWVTERPLKERMKLLSDILIPGPVVQAVPEYPNGQQLLEVMRAHRMEGIVCKNLDSAYAIGGKDGRWLKIKLFRDLYAVVGGAIVEGGVFRSLLLGLYDSESAAAGAKLVYIGRAGMGKLSGRVGEELRRALAAIEQSEMPFADKPDKFREAIWFDPRLVVKVQYMEWTPAGTMRHPVLQAMAPQENPATCTFKQL
ncbi:RNA ligase family protein [Cohnella suwonensis]|uniref:DNA ligase (ATP) n=1 Tax=Cohnella suwonensis TaxID=696072 RepID=A0ABW0M214_9BACL